MPLNALGVPGRPSLRFVVAVVAASAAVFSFGVVGKSIIDNSPAQPTSAVVADAKGFGTDLDRSATVDGRRLTLTHIVADSAMTAISYLVVPAPGDGRFVSIAPRPRLVAASGALVGFQYNSTDPNNPSRGGTLVFDPLPDGVTTVRLELDGLSFERGMVDRRFEVELTVDTRVAMRETRRGIPDVSVGSGPGSIHIAEIVVTPSSIVISGTLEDLSREEIASLGRPDYYLVFSDGTTVRPTSGSRGYGESGREIVFRFPNQLPTGTSRVSLHVDHGGAADGGEFSGANLKRLQPWDADLVLP